MADTPAAPTLLEPLLAHIPATLQAYPNWVLWRLIYREEKLPLPPSRSSPTPSPEEGGGVSGSPSPLGEGLGRGRGKFTKVPFQITGQPARSNDPSTWASFEKVCVAYKRGKGYWSGIGIMLEGSDLVGIDLDDKEGSGTLLAPDGSPTPMLAAVLAHLDTYAEVSPGGKGVRILARGTVPGSGRRGAIELYASGSPRFLTITGRRLPGARETVEERTEALAEFHREVFGSPPPPLRSTPSPTSLGAGVNKPVTHSGSAAGFSVPFTLSPNEVGE